MTHAHTSPLNGVYTALITPFHNDAIDAEAFQRLVDWQIRSGISGVVAAGTTGEAPTLERDELRHLFRLAVEAADGRVPVIAGCSSNNTRHAVALTRLAQEAGASAALHTAPYYSRPSHLGIVEHFRAIHDGSDLPVIIYNIPGRTAVDINPHTQGRIARLPRIIGVKDCSGDLSRLDVTRQSVRKPFAQLSGDDGNFADYLGAGGHGIISVTSNVRPAQVAAVFNAHAAGDHAEAQRLQAELQPLHEAMFCEASPAPVKYAAQRMGLIREDETRLPILPATTKARDIVDAAMQRTCPTSRARTLAVA